MSGAHVKSRLSRQGCEETQRALQEGPPVRIASCILLASRDATLPDI